MSYTTPQLDAAEAVAEMLTGRSIAGFTLEARSDQLLPSYDAEDLKELRIDCVPASEYSLVRENRQMVREECPVNVAIQRNCGTEDQELYRQLIALLRGIARVVALERPEGFRTPDDDVEVFEQSETVEIDGRFYGLVSAVYRVETEAA